MPDDRKKKQLNFLYNLPLLHIIRSLEFTAKVYLAIPHDKGPRNVLSSECVAVLNEAGYHHSE